ncbi:MAG TPA: DoxX family protein [Allosphingosinicella sp.]|nr:DoxX family protein [Allosphingosinicella sp.]
MSHDVFKRSDTPAAPARRLNKGLLWAAQVLCAAAFVAAGGAKLAGVPAMLEVFQASGFGQGMRYLVGASEVLFGAALLAPRLASWAAVPLLVIMAGAVFTHLVLIGGSAVPALLLAALLGLVILGRRGVAIRPPRSAALQRR